MPFLRSLLVAAGGALILALGNVLARILEPLLGFLALRGLQGLAKLTKNPELTTLYEKVKAAYNGEGGKYVEPPARIEGPGDPN